MAYKDGNYRQARTIDHRLNNMDISNMSVGDKVDEAMMNYGDSSSVVLSSIQQTRIKRSRIEEYVWREEALEDGLIKSIIDAHLMNSIGVSDGEVNNISINVSAKKREELPEMMVDFLNTEVEKLNQLLHSTYKSIVKDGLGLGDGYGAMRSEEGKGIVSVTYNNATKPYCLIPYSSNFGYTVGYEVVKNRDFLAERFFEFIPTFNVGLSGQNFHVLHFNLLDGTMETQEASPQHLEAMNPFTNTETYYQDSVHSGLLEGQKTAWDRLQSSINASLSKKVASSIIQRYIVMAMNASTKEERHILKNDMIRQMKSVSDYMKDKIATNDPTASVITHIIPTTGDNATNNVDIQESSLEFQDDMEQTTFLMKLLVGGMKYHPQLTAMSENETGDREDDSIARNSEQMEEVGGSVRTALNKAIYEAIEIHFYKLTGKKLDDVEKLFKIEYNSIVLQSVRQQEYQRTENLNNQSQFNALVDEFKSYSFDDTEESKELLMAMIKDSVPRTIDDSEKFMLDLVEHILKAPPPEGEGEEF